jgi:hypothetical protein
MEDRVWNQEVEGAEVDAEVGTGLDCAGASITLRLPLRADRGERLPVG